MNNERGIEHNVGNLADRLLDFSVRIIRLVNTLPKNDVIKHITGQLIRSGTSSGANYEEACGAESRADFAHKLSIVLKELKESRYWLRLIHRTEAVSSQTIEPVIQECEQLCAIIAKSIITVRSNK